MPELLAIAAPAGPLFVRELTEAWARGDAVLPVDPRLPVAAARELVDALRPAVIVDEAGDRQRLSDPRPVSDGDALVVATSGTTGAPKGVVLTMSAVEAATSATSEALGVDPTSDRWLAVLPVAHVGGLGVITRALLTGTPLTFDLDDPDATLTALVPTQMERTDTTRFRKILVGGSRDWRRRAANVVHTYGLTETGGGVVYDGLPLPGVEADVRNGEVWLRGPSLLRAYRDGRDPKDAEGWLRTGDAGELGEDGRLVVHGRIDDVIVTGGEKVWPDRVEAVLREDPSIADVAVVGRPDDEWGERVVAYVVAADETAPPSLERVRSIVKGRLPAWCAPKEIEIVADLPRTALGKIRRNLVG